MIFELSPRTFSQSSSSVLSSTAKNTTTYQFFDWKLLFSDSKLHVEYNYIIIFYFSKISEFLYIVFNYIS